MNSGFVYSSFKSSSVDFSPFVKRVVYAVLLCKQQASLLHGCACYHSYQVFFSLFVAVPLTGFTLQFASA